MIDGRRKSPRARGDAEKSTALDNPQRSREEHLEKVDDPGTICDLCFDRSRNFAGFRLLYCRMLGGSKPSPLGDGFSILRSSRQPLHELKFRCRSSSATKPVVCGPWNLTAEVVSSGRIPVEPRQADNCEEPGALQPASGGKLSAELRSEQDLSPLHRSPRL